MLDKSFEEFRRIYQDRFRLWRERKAQGQRIVGYLCTYLPEEILTAAGLLPIRMGGGAKETPQGDAYFYANTCTFVRNCMEMGLQGEYDFLDGLVASNTCDHIRRLFDVWSRYLKTPLARIYHLPCKVSSATLDFFREELGQFERDLEESFGVKVEEEPLRCAIRLHNRTRALLHRLYQLRRWQEPPLTGAETLEVFLAALVLPKEEYNERLERLLDHLEQRPSSDPGRARLMIIGSQLDDPDYYRLIEEQGAVVVVDDQCHGTKYFWDLVEEEGDPREALARRYLTKASCPHVHPMGPRLQHLLELARDFQVQGMIYQTIKFCDPHAEVFPVVRDHFLGAGIPVLNLEREYLMSGAGQWKTRIQAFLEGLGGRD